MLRSLGDGSFAEGEICPRRRTAAPQTETLPPCVPRDAQLVPERLQFWLGLDNVAADRGRLGHRRGVVGCRECVDLGFSTQILR
jgi:hypothetical protein